MATSPTSTAESSALEELLVRYLEACERGESVERFAHLAGHPELAGALDDYLADEALVLRCAGPTTAEAARSGDTTRLCGMPGDTSQPGGVTPDRASTRSTPLPPRFGRYEIGRLLGNGGMGEVYVAFDTVLKRNVALKVPRFSLDGDPELLQRFQHEAIAAANLQHANICPVYDIGQTDGRWYISMALIEGECLHEPRPRELLREPRAAAELVRILAQTLAETHARGIVHRDLKPSNVMLDQRGAPVILDFGLALQLNSSDRSRLTQEGIIVGTLAYMSPEQLEGGGGEVGPASDIYSLGVVFYELLTGQLPFAGSPRALIPQILHKTPEPPEKLRPEIDPRLQEICLRMLAKQPAERHATMAEVAEALAGALTGDPLQPSPAPHSAAGNPPRIRFWVAGAIAGLAVAVAGLFAAPVVLSIATSRGTVRVIVNDPSIKVTLAGEEISIDRSGEVIRITPGQESMTVRHGETSYQTQAFELGKGENPVISVSLLKEAIDVRQGERLVDSHPLPVFKPERPSPPEQANTESEKPAPPPVESRAEKANKLYAEAVKQHRTGNYRDAMTTLDQAIKLNDKFAEAYLLRGQIIKRYWQRSENDKRYAFQSLDRAVSLNPKSAEAWAERAELNQWVGEAKRDNALLDKSVKDYTSALGLKEEWKWLFQRAWVGASLQRWDDSDRDYRRVIEILRKDVKKLDDLPADKRQHLAWAYLNNVNGRLAKGDVVAALAHGKEAVEVAPTMPAALLNLARAHRAHRDYKEAEQSFKKLLELDPYNISAFRGLADMYSELSEAEAAEQNFLLALQAGSTEPYDALDCARCAMQRGNAEGAIALLDRVRPALAKEPLLPLSRGAALGVLGDNEQYLAGIEAALQLDARHVSALCAKGELLWRSGKREEAQAIWNEADKALTEQFEKESRAGSRVVRASLRKALHRFDEAQADYEAIVAADPRDFWALSSLAEILAAHPDADRRNPAKAIELARRACELTNDEHAWSLSILAESHAAAGEFNEAARRQKQAVARVANESKREYLERLAALERKEPFVFAREPREPRFDVDVRSVAVDHEKIAVAGFAALAPREERTELSAKDIAARFTNAVVLLKGPSGFGTGMILSEDGYVLTCAHVLPYRGDPTAYYESADSEGQFEAREAPATVLYLDYRRDLALVKFTPEGKLTTVRLAPAAAAVEQGDSVTTLGNPGEAEFILKKSLLPGIVSSASQNVGSYVPRKRIQTSIPITGGFSGGPLFNKHGEVIGVVAARARTATAGFAIPMSEVASLLGIEK